MKPILSMLSLLLLSLSLQSCAPGEKRPSVKTLESDSERFGYALGLAFQHADDLKDEDYPRYREQSLRRAVELAEQATETARSFGEEGTALVALAELVLRRAQEATQDEPSAAD